MSIASLPRPASLPAHAYVTFAALRAAGFAGEIRADHANRTVQATDNSIYQRLPQAVICPAQADDPVLARLLAEPASRCRGGARRHGTNGQSLTDGVVVVDLSRNMNRISKSTSSSAGARAGGRRQGSAQRGAEAARLFFAPELSTSNRATVGGMINTDASGQGSCTYGKTRDHVLEPISC